MEGSPALRLCFKFHSMKWTCTWAGSLALQKAELEMELQKEKDNGQKLEAINKQLLEDLKQVLDDVVTLKAEAPQVGPPVHMPPLAPAHKGSVQDHSPVLVIDQ